MATRDVVPSPEEIPQLTAGALEAAAKDGNWAEALGQSGIIRQ